MSFMTRSARAVSFAAAAALFAVSLPIPGAEAAAKKQAGGQEAGGQQAGQPPQDGEQAAKKSAAEAAKRAYDNGIKSYQAGKYQPAVDQLSSALRGGGLSSTDMARGLYYRGLAYKKQSKPGLAISDLTSALWLKNGLSDAERQSATAERAEAYKAAGLGDGNSGADTVAASDPKSESTPAARQAAQGPASAPAASAAPSSGAVGGSPAPQAVAAEAGVPQPLSLGGETAVPAPPKVRQAAVNDPAGLQSAVAARYATTGASAQNPGSSLDQATAFNQPASPASPAPHAVALNAVPNEPAAAPAPAASGGAAGGIGSFFSNLFSPAASQSPAPQDASPASNVTTASTTQAAPQTSSWSNQTSLSEGAAKKGKATKAAAGPQPAAAATEVKTAATKSKGGKYKLHIAAVRSRAEADALAHKLSQEHGGALKDKAPAVDEAVIGSMGTFYRVRIGSYATADEPRGLCNTLRNSGYDCLVVSN